MDIFPLVAASVAGLAVVLISLVGLVTKIPAIKAAIESRLTLLSSFSAGVFLMVGVMLMIEIFEGGISFWPVASVVIGALGSLALSLIPEYHHHHYEKNTPHKHSKQSAMRILVSDGLHNMGDGVLLIAAFSASTALGITAAIGIFIHEILQEISKFFLLRQSGYSVNRAVKWSVIVSTTVFAGIALGTFAAGIQELLLGFAAGSLFAVVFKDLIPSSMQTSKEESKRFLHLFVFIIGASVMLVLHSIFHHHH